MNSAGRSETERKISPELTSIGRTRAVKTSNELKLQFRALGLIMGAQPNDSEGQPCWTLTPYGDNVLTRIAAFPREKTTC